MVNVCCISNGARPRLLEQTLRTLYDHTPPSQFTVTMIDDRHGGIDLPGALIDRLNDYCCVAVTPWGVVGGLKNLGAYWSERYFSRGEWLMFIDDDVAFFPGWLHRMIAASEAVNQVRVLGGVRHPYHGINNVMQYAKLTNGAYAPGQILDLSSGCESGKIELTDAVAGYCHFMRWSTWDRFGPYAANAKGTGQSEDFQFCRKVVDAGGAVGYLSPPCMAHCGLTNSEGKPILGADLIERVPGVLYL